jgi:hypothetical protein
MQSTKVNNEKWKKRPKPPKNVEKKKNAFQCLHDRLSLASVQCQITGPKQKL